MRVSNKQRMSISLDREIVAWLDRGIKEKRFANRSHAIEFCIQQVINAEGKKGAKGL